MSEDVSARVILDCNTTNVLESINILRTELMKHEELYEGFSVSIACALKEYWCCGLPFEPEEDVAKKILDYVIGEEYEKKE